MHALRTTIPTPARFLALCALAVACQVPAAPPERAAARGVPTYDAETFYATTSVSGASFSPDGRTLLVTSDASGIYNAHAIPVAGGGLKQLTHSTTDAIFAQGWFPEDERFLFTKDQGGNELNHLYVREADGSIVDLTPGENLKASFRGWAGDERSFFVQTNERDAKSFDLYEYEVSGAVEASTGAARYPRRMVYENPGGFNVSDISRDGAWIALTKVRNNADNDVYLWSVAQPGEEPRHVTPHEGNVSHGVEDFSPDGTKLFYTSDEGSEFARVWSYDLATGEREVVFADDWDVSTYAFSRDGRHLITSVNADARTELLVFEAGTMEEVELPDIPAGDVRGVSIQPGGELMAFYVNGDSSPSNLYMLNLTTGASRRLTDTLSREIDEAHLVEGEVVRFPSFDELSVPGILYRPHQATAGAPAPALVWVHGGPGGQSRHGYNPMIQHLVNHGYAVLAINNRGSSGYGKTFYHLDDKRHGDVDLKDCIWARRHLESLPWVDGGKVGIIGGSYGGYMVCAALAFAPEAFDVGVNIFGVTNWVRTLESIPPWWSDFREALYAELGDPERDRASLEARSPLFHAKNIVKPMLVVQGANDPRVLQAESDDMVAAVRANGVFVEYVLFPDEGHGFRRKENRITASKAFVEFLDTHLRGEGGS